MRVALFGHRGKVGSVVASALVAAGHEVDGIGPHDRRELDGADASVDFTRPDVAAANARTSLEQGVPAIVGTSGADLSEVGKEARERGLQLFQVPNFAVGAVLMMRFAAEAFRFLDRAEIVELHNEAKRDAPSATAKATAARLDGEVPIHAVRLPGLVAHQEVLLAGPGELLTIRHDALSREAYVPGVLLALERLASLPPGLTTGLDAVL
jgi:4-hydroxy-tetrahydrodipicolinate reductase